jgi:hypothetical protein
VSDDAQKNKTMACCHRGPISGPVEVLDVHRNVWKVLISNRMGKWAFVNVDDLSFDNPQDVNAFYRMLLGEVVQSSNVTVEGNVIVTRGAMERYLDREEGQ